MSRALSIFMGAIGAIYFTWLLLFPITLPMNTFTKLFLLTAISFGGLSSLEAKEKALVIISSSQVMTLENGKEYETGYYLGELAGPSMTLKKMGFELVFANPLGNKVEMDKASDAVQWFSGEEEYKKAKEFVENEKALQNPVKLSTVIEEGLDQFTVVLVPGGHAPMEDLVANAEVAKILNYFHKNSKPTALICHGPAALLSTVPSAQEESWIYDGYKMTAFSTSEEQVQEGTAENPGPLGGKMKFYLDEALSDAGAVYSKGENWTSYVVRHKELITAQNPQSETEFSQALSEALVDYYIKQNNVQLHQVFPSAESAHKTFYLGKRSAELSETDFQAWLLSHIKLVEKNLKPLGMTSYEVLLWGDFEVAIQGWTSAEAADAAFKTDAGTAVIQDSTNRLDLIAFKKRHQE